MCFHINSIVLVLSSLIYRTKYEMFLVCLPQLYKHGPPIMPATKSSHMSYKPSFTCSSQSMYDSKVGDVINIIFACRKFQHAPTPITASPPQPNFGLIHCQQSFALCLLMPVFVLQDYCCAQRNNCSPRDKKMYG